MNKFVINGPNKAVKGEIDISGAKNSCLPLMAASIFIFMAYYFSIPAMQYGEVSFVSPFRFTLMIWAVVFGFIFFQEIPDYLTAVGLLIVIAAGVFTYFREKYSHHSPKHHR